MTECIRTEVFLSFIYNVLDLYYPGQVLVPISRSYQRYITTTIVFLFQMLVFCADYDSCGAHAAGIYVIFNEEISVVACWANSMVNL